MYTLCKNKYKQGTYENTEYAVSLLQCNTCCRNNTLKWMNQWWSWIMRINNEQLKLTYVDIADLTTHNKNEEEKTIAQHRTIVKLKQCEEHYTL